MHCLTVLLLLALLPRNGGCVHDKAVFVASVNYSATAISTSDPVYCHRYFEARLAVLSFWPVFVFYPNCCRSLILATVLHLIAMSFRTTFKKTFTKHG